MGRQGGVPAESTGPRGLVLPGDVEASAATLGTVPTAPRRGPTSCLGNRGEFSGTEGAHREHS